MIVKKQTRREGIAYQSLNPESQVAISDSIWRLNPRGEFLLSFPFQFYLQLYLLTWLNNLT